MWPRVDRTVVTAVGLLIVRGTSRCLGDLNERYKAGVWQLAPYLLVSAIAINILVLGALVLLAGIRRLSLRKPNTRKGLRVMLAGANCLALALAAGNMPTSSRNDVLIEWSDLPVFFAVIAGGFGVFLMRQGWKYDAVGAREVLAADPRPPVIYLRSFKDDVKVPTQRWWGIFLKLFMWWLPVSFEQDLAEIMNRLGPFIAVGRPGERLPELGAARFYFDDSEWRARVSDQMQTARLLVILSGTTSNLWWEIDQAMRLMRPQQVVLISLERGKPTRLFEQQLEQRLGCPGALQTAAEAKKPPLIKRLLFRRHNFGKVIYFGDDWQPQVAPIRIDDMRAIFRVISRPYSLYGLPLELAFEGVFKGLGLPWKHAGRSRMVAVTLAVCVGFCGLHQFYLGQKRKRFLPSRLLLDLCPSRSWLD